MKEVPSSRLHIPVLFKTITTHHMSKAQCPGQGRKRNTCSGLNHETTLSCSAWEKKFRCTVWEESSCGPGRGNSFCYRGLNSTSQFSSALRNSSCFLGTIICWARHPAEHQLSSQQTLEHAPVHRQETTGLNLQSRLCDSFSLLPASPPHPLLKGKTVPFPAPNPSYPLRKAGPPVHSLLGAVAAVGGVGRRLFSRYKVLFVPSTGLSCCFSCFQPSWGPWEKGQGQFRNVTVFSLSHLSRATACLFDPWP